MKKQITILLAVVSIVVSICAVYNATATAGHTAQQSSHSHVMQCCAVSSGAFITSSSLVSFFFASIGFASFVLFSTPRKRVVSIYHPPIG